MQTVLFCTVGGSHQPILKAIDEQHPDHVVFFCTGPDPETGQAGSEKQITGKGNVISSRFGEPASLPNIPLQAGLSENQFTVSLVPSDDLDTAFVIMSNVLREKQLEFPQAVFVADYTGGTKTMTAALVTAVLESDNIELQLVTGARANLIKVENRSEYAVNANVDGIRLKRRMQPFLKAWYRFAYDEAADGLGHISIPRDTRLRSELNRAANLSKALAAWDRFDHRQAFSLLDTYRAKIGKSLGLHLKALAMLNEDDAKRREPLQLYDLWLNAERRAAQGRYDDAVARVYRLLEWTAQWQLRIHTGIETKDIPEAKIPPELTITQNREGIFQAGLFQAWQLIGALLDNPAHRFIEQNNKKLLDHLLLRNESILAHGFTPIEKPQWENMAAWMKEAFLPVLTELARNDAEIRFDINRLQLPKEYPVIN